MIVKLLFKNEPLANKMIKNSNKTDSQKSTPLKLKTNKKGVLNLILEKKGNWSTSSKDSIVLKNNLEADYHSY